jgi:hypothetical protein
MTQILASILAFAGVAPRTVPINAAVKAKADAAHFALVAGSRVGAPCGDVTK